MTTSRTTLVGIAMALGILGIGSPGPGLAAEVQAPQTNTVGMAMVPIQPGDFVMGQDGVAEESPAHKVKITRPYALAATEVTRGQWKAVMGAEPPDLNLKDQTDQHPVVGITWFEAVEFCKKLSAKEGKTYRLPTEAEWEYACRAGTTTAYWFGDKPDLAKMVGKSDPRDRRPVGRTDHGPMQVASVPANAWDLHDMHGNVHEWCYDWFGCQHYLLDALARFLASLPPEERTRNSYVSEYGWPGGPDYSPPEWPTKSEWNGSNTVRLTAAVKLAADDPLGPERGDAGKRALRGGSWLDPCRESRSTSRKGADPLWRNRTIGFRVLSETDDRGPLRSGRLSFPNPPGTIDLPGYGQLPEVFVNSLGLRFILVRPGAFIMGMRPEEVAVMKGNSANTVNQVNPLVRVTISKPYYLANVEISDAHLKMCDIPSLSFAPYPMPSSLPTFPSYFGARRFCYALAVREGRAYRLPTSAEWEYAARAGTTTAWPWGDRMDGIEAYEYIGSLTCYTPLEFLPGGCRRPNPWGFYDMLGNTAEMVTDFNWLPALFTSQEPLCDPTGPTYAEVQRARQDNKWPYGTVLNLKRGGSNRHAIPWASPGMSGRGKMGVFQGNPAYGARLALDAAEVLRKNDNDFMAARARARREEVDLSVVMADEAVFLNNQKLAIALYREVLEAAPDHVQAKSRLAVLEATTPQPPSK